MQATGHDVLAVTARGNAELRGGGTSLPPINLQALILVDGKSTVAQVVESAPGLDRELLAEALSRLLEQGYVARATDPDAHSLDPDSTLNMNIAGGASPLVANGFRVAIARRAAAVRAAAAGTKVQVLAIDADTTFAKILRAYFEPPQFVVTIAGDKAQIVHALRRPPLPDVVLANASMESIDAIVAAIRRHEILGKIPVIMFAGNDTRAAAIQALQSGVSGYLTRPTDMDVLVVSVRNVLGLPQERAATMGFGEKTVV